MDPLRKLKLGFWGERQAESYLENKGFRRLQRNFRTREGEIDLIMLDQDEVVFVEVKTRISTEFGLPEESITKQKLTRIVQVAETYLQQGDRQDDHWRLDLIMIECTSAREVLRLEHYENIGLTEI